MSKISSNVPPAVRKQVNEANRQANEQKALRSGQPAPIAAPPAPAPVPGMQMQPVTQFVPGQEPAQPPVSAQPPAPPAPPATATDPAIAPAPEVDFKHRFKVLQGKYNTETARLAAENEFLRTQNQQLIARPAAPAQAPAQPQTPAPLAGVTAEEIQEYGPELLDVVRRVAASAVQPRLAQVENEFTQVRAQVGNASQAMQRSAQLSVYDALNKFDEDWELTNNSEEFLAWLAVHDIYSGLTRKQGLMSAFESNDAARVVAIFKAFKEEDSRSRPTARVPVVDPATLVAPGTSGSGAPAAPANEAGRIWSEPEIAAFNQRVRKGRISAEERTLIEKEIMLAAREGRIRPTVNTANLANAAV